MWMPKPCSGDFKILIILRRPTAYVLKDLEHRKLGWKVLILKYDLGKSLSKEMWCEMADTKKNDFIFKKNEKCM